MDIVVYILISLTALMALFLLWGCCCIAGEIDQADEDRGLGRRS